ncbi:hypothetical protein [Kibdelosporangium phytohabitans]|uniref:IrrE N-terminal-like domain-containing protein n=1 Tax=Kibdelosporangium phytohabitans TaxID=860235 RepID=A0A0N9I444_9PSEU|nr:hypothetical protein [Kibdelosporangium phytohabitans]ALG10841.1 hypothetical protein AOZ06_31675 [Kibdelosporangium phytohabitans]MBE1462016.1 hypothetical protein [Kibdelosporangium phytohabitans]
MILETVQAMTWKQARTEATVLVAELPPLPRPWRIEELCAALARRRGRPLLLHELDLAALPFGLWYFDGERDHIISRAGTTGYHRDHIILHELCHMLAGHNTAPGPAAGDGLAAQVIAAAVTNPHTNAQEELAEAFATIVLKQARKRPPGGDFEQRASAVFGAA